MNYNSLESTAIAIATSAAACHRYHRRHDNTEEQLVRVCSRIIMPVFISTLRSRVMLVGASKLVGALLLPLSSLRTGLESGTWRNLSQVFH